MFVNGHGIDHEIEIIIFINYVRASVQPIFHELVGNGLGIITGNTFLNFFRQVLDVGLLVRSEVQFHNSKIKPLDSNLIELVIELVRLRSNALSASDWS